MENDKIKIDDLLLPMSSEIEEIKTNKYLLSREEFIKIINNKSDD